MKKRRSFVAMTLFAALVSLQSAGVDAEALPKRFDAEPFEDKKTPAPTVKEWANAPPVLMTSGLASGCKAFRIREWIKIHCADLITLQLTLLGGEPEGVSFYIPPAPQDETWTRRGEIIFPVRRGDRRMFEWATAGDSYSGSA